MAAPSRGCAAGSHHTRTAPPAARLLADEETVLDVSAQEDPSPALLALADRGRAVHAEWCERVFAPSMAELRGAGRARRLARLIAVTDMQPGGCCAMTGG